jgi:hypothetical protein
MMMAMLPFIVVLVPNHRERELEKKKREKE